MDIRIEVKGLKQVRRLMKPPSELFGQPWKEAMQELVEFGAQSGQRMGPRGRTLALTSKIAWAVQRKPLPLWARVKATARRRSRSYRRGFEYPRLLNYAAKWGHKGWFDQSVISPIMGKANSALSNAAKKVEHKWRWSFRGG